MQHKVVEPSVKPSSPKGTQTLARGLEILQIVASDIKDAGEIARAVGIPRSTAHRMLSSLVQLGYLYNLPSHGYLLGPELVFLGHKAKEQQPLALVAEPHLKALASKTRDTVHLGIPDGVEVFYLSKINGTQGGLVMRSKVGQRMPMAFTGLGKALLIGLPSELWRDYYDRGCAMQAGHPERVAPRPWKEVEIDLARSKEKGFAVDMEENEIGIRCVAAPIFDISGKLVASISVASAVPFMPLERMDELAPLVRETSAAISQDLGRRDVD
ncbi:IclR family transcriptional regulator [Cohaesibacter haloalkalitolerans]|uniref:IclR family transcriptional regulator n=1 Tax=Cohaesibacter haloalkalitolerans TaxID=1162980 RepID=UPI000E65AD53|nr:IclR family transcriptional regulator [Cohaesibacter haloalkalitolerans]